MRRKRRTRYTWLPVVGSTRILAPDTFRSTWQSNGILVNNDNSPVTQFETVAIDLPADAGDTGVPNLMGSIIGNEYFLKRIVGKFYCYYSQVASANVVPRAVIVGVGFFVGRAGDGALQNTPIGTGITAQEDFDNYSPLARDCIREPWIWRRTWKLSNTRDTTATTGINFFPATNTGYGSVLDGPHIDAKTARRVKQDERLFLSISTNAELGSDGNAEGVGIVNYSFDVRLLGQLRRARQQGSF